MGRGGQNMERGGQGRNRGSDILSEKQSFDVGSSWRINSGYFI
jgi:hypothetical protein